MRKQEMPIKVGFDMQHRHFLDLVVAYKFEFGRWAAWFYVGVAETKKYLDMISAM